MPTPKADPALLVALIWPRSFGSSKSETPAQCPKEAVKINDNVAEGAWHLVQDDELAAWAAEHSCSPEVQGERDVEEVMPSRHIDLVVEKKEEKKETKVKDETIDGQVVKTRAKSKGRSQGQDKTSFISRLSSECQYTQKQAAAAAAYTQLIYSVHSSYIQRIYTAHTRSTCTRFTYKVRMHGYSSK